jgi:DNA-binding transcriptional ArsR family regulator
VPPWRLAAAARCRRREHLNPAHAVDNIRPHCYHFYISENERTGEAVIKRSFKSCSVVCFNEAKIAALKKRLPPPPDLRAAASRCKALGHPARQAILHVLSADECCVCDVAEVLGRPVSTVSQHLRLLMTAGLLDYRQEGKLVFYTLTEEGRAAARRRCGTPGRRRRTLPDD